MQYQFLQNARIAGKVYALGIHDVPQEHTKDPYFKMLQKSEMIKIPADDKKPVQASPVKGSIEARQLEVVERKMEAQKAKAAEQKELASEEKPSKKSKG